MPSVSPISLSFGRSTGSKEQQEKKLQRAQLASLSARDIRALSILKADKEVNDSFAAKVSRNEPILFTTVLPLIYGAAARGPLSTKLGIAASAMAVFTTASIVFNKTGKLLQRIDDNVPPLKEEKRKHTLLASATEIGLGIGAIVGIGFAAYKGKNLFVENYPTAANKIVGHLTKAANEIDKSRFGKASERMSTAVDKFMDKHPKTNYAANMFDGWGLPIAWIAGFSVLANSLSAKKRNKIEDESESLMRLREVARQEIKDEYESKNKGSKKHKCKDSDCEE